MAYLYLYFVDVCSLECTGLDICKHSESGPSGIGPLLQPSFGTRRVISMNDGERLEEEMEREAKRQKVGVIFMQMILSSLMSGYNQQNPSDRFLEKRTEILDQFLRRHASLIRE